MRPVASLTLHSVTALASHTLHTLAGAVEAPSPSLSPLPSLPISGNSTLSIYFCKPVTWGLHGVSLSPQHHPISRSVDFLPPEYPFPHFCITTPGQDSDTWTAEIAYRDVGVGRVGVGAGEWSQGPGVEVGDSMVYLSVCVSLLMYPSVSFPGLTFCKGPDSKYLTL